MIKQPYKGMTNYKRHNSDKKKKQRQVMALFTEEMMRMWSLLPPNMIGTCESGLQVLKQKLGNVRKKEEAR